MCRTEIYKIYISENRSEEENQYIFILKKKVKLMNNSSLTRLYGGESN
jgi:hypothetical protein